MNIPRETVETAARAIAKAANADYWVDEIAEWEAQEEWEKEAFEESSYPANAYEDRDDYMKQGRAALEAVAPLIRAETLRELAVHVAAQGVIGPEEIRDFAAELVQL